MSGGGGGVVSQVAQQSAPQQAAPQQAAPQQAVAQRSNPYQSSFNPYQSSFNPYAQPSALNRQMAQRQAAPQSPYMQGLQSLYRIFSSPRQYNPMPQYQNPALSYRPDMSSAQQNLRRVMPSVQEQQRLQAIEDARIAAEQAALDAQEAEAARQNNSTWG